MTTPRDALKPCPFCGWDTPAVSYTQTGSAWVSCGRCLASSGGFHEPDMAEHILRDKAAAEWNRRAALQASE